MSHTSGAACTSAGSRRSRRRRIHARRCGAQIQWTYDDAAVAYSRGRLTRVDDLAVSTRFAYNALGRVTETVRLLDGTAHVMSQSHDALGRVVSQTFPDGETVTYAYNEAGWLSAIPGYVTSLAHNARGQRTQMQAANGVTTTWTYEPTTFRLSQAQTAGGATPLQNLTYTHDAGGNMLTGAGRALAWDADGRRAGGGAGGALIHRRGSARVRA